MDSDEWESDGEFEATILDLDKQESTSTIITSSKVKAEPAVPPMCSTPIANSSKQVHLTSAVTDSVSSINSAVSFKINKVFPAVTPSPAAAGGEKPKSSSSKKRKFPGPAGVLPKLKQDVNIRSLKDVPVAVEPKRQENEEVVSSQSSQPLSVSSYSTWRKMVADIELSKEHLQKYSIANTLANASRRQLPEGKAPLLVAVLVSINKSLPDATVTLKDLTGSITGILHRLLIKQQQEHLKIGSTLLLKQISVFSPSRTRQYLNITPNNVLQIYSECDRTSEITRTQVTQSPVPFQTLLAQPVFTPKSKNMHSTSTPSSKGHRLFTTSHHAEPRPLAERVNYKSLDKQSKCLGKLSNLSDQLEKQITGRQPATTNQDSANRSNILHNNSSTQGNTARLTNQNDFCPSRLTNQQPDCTKTSSLNTNQHLFDDDDLDDINF